MDFRADLHCHSTCSDGALTPAELVDLALEIGLSGLSITDHDNIDAYLLALPHAKERGLLLLPGVEFSATFKETSIHVLGYAFSLHNPAIQEFCREHMEQRSQRNRNIMELLTYKGIKIVERDLLEIAFKRTQKDSKAVGRPHIAQVLVNKGYVRNVQEAFDKYIGDGKPCYDPGVKSPIGETIDIIHQSGGVAVLAHPHLIYRKRILREVLKMDFDGIEAYYARFPPKQIKKWVEMGKERNLIVTGGSDFHGGGKAETPLGSSWVSAKLFHSLYDNFNRLDKHHDEAE